MKTFELLSIIGSVVAVGIALGVVVIGSVVNLRTEGPLEWLRDAIMTTRPQAPPARKEST